MNIQSFFMTAAFAALLIPQSQAQVGIKAGVNFASIAESARLEEYETLENKSVAGFQAGLQFDLGLSDVFTIQPELLFIQKGGKSTYQINENNKIVSRLYYNYVEVPVLAKLKFYGEDGGAGFYVLGGPFLGLAISGKSQTTTTLLGEPTTVTDKFDFDNDSQEERHRRADWGVSFGAGVKFGHVFVDARYNLGINNILDSDANNQNDDKAYRRTRGLGLTLGYEF